jgi:predicted CXXCH cytochrome family protein
MKARLFLFGVLLSAGLVTFVPVLLTARAEEGENVRKGRPRPQVTYKGSSPWFKVDFDRYTGKVTCIWCHPKATEIWEREEAFHRDAFARLDEQARANPDCVKCHVTAFNQDGEYPLEWDTDKTSARKMGYTWGGDPDVNAIFTGVQCESCHGPNCGNKYSREDLEEICLGCHNEEYPGFTGFDVEAAFKRMKHAAAGADERIKFDSYAGLDSCNMCHWPNYGSFREHQAPHGRAFEVLGDEDRENPACLKCHTTGFSRDGVYPLEEEADRKSRRSGYALGGPAEQLRKFQGVQCEACHGINCGTLTTTERIRKQCVKCHSGECDADDGFEWERDYEQVRHRPPADYEPAGDPKVLIEFYDLEDGLSTAKIFRTPLLVLFSNPPDG